MYATQQNYPSTVVHDFNPRAEAEAKAGGSLSSGQPGVYSEFQDSQNCIEAMSPKNKQKTHLFKYRCLVSQKIYNIPKPN